MNEQQFQRFISKSNTDARSWTKSKWNERILINVVLVFRQKSFRFEIIGCIKISWITVQSPIAEKNCCVTFDFDVLVTPVLGTNSFWAIKWWSQAKCFIYTRCKIWCFIVSDGIVVNIAIRFLENFVDFNL